MSQVFFNHRHLFLLVTSNLIFHSFLAAYLKMTLFYGLSFLDFLNSWNVRCCCAVRSSVQGHKSRWKPGDETTHAACMMTWWPRLISTPWYTGRRVNRNRRSYLHRKLYITCHKTKQSMLWGGSGEHRSHYWPETHSYLSSSDPIHP